MSRNRKTAKDAGTRFAQSIADYLATHLYDDRIERRTNRGAKDRGDISGVRHAGQRIVIECKEYGGRLIPTTWTAEAEIERGNDDALAGVVVAKRRGTTDPGRQWVLMTVDELVALLSGARPGDET